MQFQSLTDTELTYYSQEYYDEDYARTLHQVWINGPRGIVTARNQVCVLERADYIEFLYTEITRSLDGYYHCCFDGNVDWL